MTDKTNETSSKFTSHEKKLYNTLDVFAQGKTGKAHIDTSEDISNGIVHETSHVDLEIAVPQQTAIVSASTEISNGETSQRQREQVSLQTGAKLYRGEGRRHSEAEEHDAVEDSIKEFLSVPNPKTWNATNGNLKKEALCYLWYPDDKRRWICEEGFNYLSKRVKERGVTLKVDPVDLRHFNLDYPVLILCIHPPEDKPNISLGDMPVVLVILHRQSQSIGDPEPPLANDLYWRRYRNLSLILDMTASAQDSFHDTRTNMDTAYRLSEFLKTWT